MRITAVRFRRVNSKDFEDGVLLIAGNVKLLVDFEACVVTSPVEEVAHRAKVGIVNPTKPRASRVGIPFPRIKRA